MQPAALRRLAVVVRRAPRAHVRAMASSSSAAGPRPPRLIRRDVRLGLIQMSVGPDKRENLHHAGYRIAKAAKAGCNIVVLPECFNSPYGCSHFPTYAETLLPSPPPWQEAPSFDFLSRMAKRNGVYLIGGSIPERDPDDPDRYYNTCLTFAPDGRLIDTFRKIHLFDIDIPGKITFKESDVLSPGNSMSLVDLPEYGKIGIGICYDVRFPELATIAARNGAFALIYPGAFNLTTGSLHWELLARARALDNQVFVAMCSPSRDMTANYNAYGHSIIVDPMAKVLAQASHKEDVIIHGMTNKHITEVRKNLPLNDQRRFDVYPDISRLDVRPGNPSADPKQSGTPSGEPSKESSPSKKPDETRSEEPPATKDEGRMQSEEPSA